MAAEISAREEAPAGAWWIHPGVPMLAAAIAFAWILRAQLSRMYGMTGEAWDLAYYQHVVWGITQGSFDIHLEPILFPIALVERLWPSPIVLALFSTAGLAASGPTAYLFFRALLPDRAAAAWLAVALGAPVPFWAAMQQAAGGFFHPEDLALAFALAGAWAGLRGRLAWMWIFVALDLACGLDQAYTVAVMALLLRARGAPDVKKQWRFLLYIAAAWSVIGAAVIQENPGALGPPLSWQTIAIELASMAALPLLAPRWLVLAIPPVLAGLFGGDHVLFPMFPLLLAGGAGARRVLEWDRYRPAMAVAVVVPALALGAGTGVLPPGLLAAGSLYDQPDAVGRLQQAAAVIPPAAPVNADAGLDVWLANRPVIDDFPDKLDATSYVVVDRDYYVSDHTNRAARSVAAAALPNSGRRLLYDDGRFQVWSPVGD